MDVPEDINQFYLQNVLPFYGGLMNLNFLQPQVVGNPKEFITQVAALQTTLTDTDIISLLMYHNWRAAKVGAWIIGIHKLTHLVTYLIKKLEDTPTHAEHIIYALALVNTKEGTKAIGAFMVAALEKIVCMWQDNVWLAVDSLQNYAIDSGFEVLTYLDAKNGTTYKSEVLNAYYWLLGCVMRKNK